MNKIYTQNWQYGKLSERIKSTHCNETRNHKLKLPLKKHTGNIKIWQKTFKTEYYKHYCQYGKSSNELKLQT